MRWASASQAVGIAASSSLDNLSFGVAYALKGVKIGVACNGLVAALNSGGMLGTMLAGRWIVATLPSRVGPLAAGCVYLALGVWETARLALVLGRRRRRRARQENDVEAPPIELTHEEDEAATDRVDEAATDRVPSPAPSEEDTHDDDDDTLLLWTDRDGELPCKDADEPRNVVPFVTVQSFVFFGRACGYEVVEEPASVVRWLRSREALFLGLALTVSNVAAGLAAGAAGLDVTVTVAATFIASFVFMLAGQRLGAALRRGATAVCRCTHHDVAALAACFFLAYGIAILVSS